MKLYVGAVVEGFTEMDCLRILLERIWFEHLSQSTGIEILKPARGHRDELVNPNGIELERKIEWAYQRLISYLKRDASGIPLLLLLIDAEYECPANLGKRMLKLAQSKLPYEANIACVLPKLMFENWILAGASTIADVKGMPKVIPARDRFETRSGANWIQEQLHLVRPNRKYKKREDAPALVQAMNLQECHDNSPSFRKLVRELEKRIPKPPPEPAPSDDAGPAQ